MAATHWDALRAYLDTSRDDDGAEDTDATQPDPQDTPSETPPPDDPATPPADPTPAPKADQKKSSKPDPTIQKGRAKLGIFGGNAARSVGSFPRPGGIGPLIAALLVALVIVIPVASGKTRLQHLLDVLTGAEGFSPSNPTIESGLPGDTGVSGGAEDLNAAPSTPLYKAALPYPVSSRGVNGGQSWLV